MERGDIIPFPPRHSYRSEKEKESREPRRRRRGGRRRPSSRGPAARATAPSGPNAYPLGCPARPRGTTKRSSTIHFSSCHAFIFILFLAFLLRFLRSKEKQSHENRKENKKNMPFISYVHPLEGITSSRFHRGLQKLRRARKRSYGEG